jgi:superfamily II DNA or RNA helicase
MASASFFETVRKAASRRAWSRGVELVRAQAVGLESEGADELRLRVAEPGAVVARAVTLLPADDAWDCDCAGDEDPCEHVAAAVIAWRQADGALPRTAPGAGGGRLRYGLARAPGGLALARLVVAPDGSEQPLAVRLRALAAGRVAGPRVAAEEADLAVDDALDDPRGGVLGRAALARLLPLLARCADVRLDGAPLRCDPEPLAPQGFVEDHAGGFLLRVELLPPGAEPIGDGFALVAGALRPLRETRLTGRELAQLPRGEFFPTERAAELAGEVLPDLARRIPVEVRTQRLPRAGARREPPRIVVATRRDGDALAVRADLVYGDPPRARVEEGRLVSLGGAVPVRDEAAERALARRVHGELALPVGAELLLRDEAALEAAARLRSWPGEVRGDAHTAFFRAAPLVPRLGGDGVRVDLWFEAEAGGGRPPLRVDAARALRAWEEGRTLVSSGEAGFAPLPGDWLARFGREAAALLEQRRADGSVPRAALPDLARLAAAVGAPPPPALEGLRALVDGFTATPPAALPADLRAELRSYQRAGADWLCFLRDAGLGALLADDMGLGKTLQVLCALPAPGAARTLVVCPTSVLQNWADELRRFRPGLVVSAYHGPGRRLDPAADVTLTTYALLRLDSEVLAAAAWDAVVLDEAQAIKNPDSQVARAAFALRAGWRVAVTGTPVENRLEELWSQLHFASPGLLGALGSFQARWARPIAAGEPGVAETLRRRLRPFVLRRTKREVAPELPPRIERVLRCELDADERAVYEAIRAATRREVVERLAAGASPLAALEALLRLRQAACHRGLVPGQQAETSSKLELLVEELGTAVAEGHKALVFSQWTSLLDRVEPALAAAGIAWTRLDGATRDRAGVVARFQDDAGPPVLLVSLKAGGTGLNLTAADHVFLLDPWWNPAVEDQAADRAHRIGQTRPVEIHRLVAADSVEERVLALQQRKRAAADAVLGEAGAAAALTRDDLLALLD